MKLLKIVLTKTLVLFGAVVLAQSSTHLKLSNSAPKAEEVVSFIYNPDGTVLDRKKIQATIYFLDNDRFPVADADLRADGKLLKGEFTIPENTKAFCVKLNDGANLDSNNGNGYLYLVYQNNGPVNGAYAAKAYAIGLGSDLFGVKKNMEASASLYKQEFGLHPDLEKDYEDLYLLTLFYSNAADQQLAYKRAVTLAQSKSEQNKIWALNYYRHSKKTTQADSLLLILKTQFPDGIEAKIELAAAFDNEQDIIKKDSLYNVLVAKYPIKDGAAATALDYKRIQLAIAYLRLDDMNGFAKWQEQVINKSGLPSDIYDVTAAWAKNGEHLSDAEKATKQALALLDSLCKNNIPRMYLSPKQAKEDNRETYNQCADIYALILYKENKYKEALIYEQPIYNGTKIQDEDITAHYAAILNANSMYVEAKSVIEKCFAMGISSSALKEELEKAYSKINGSNNGFDDYLKTLTQSAYKRKLDEMSKTMIKVPAPAFNLKGLSGERVSLASLKGKVVVIDFWATWCGPCKESFPGMQMMVDKYKNDPGVQFVFIDTWENGSDYVAEARKYITANKYDFNVLFDEKATDGRLSKIRLAYGVDGLPTKIIVDKNGNIRFKTSGYPGSSETLDSELTSMIELTKGY